jgi:DNA-binding transcriptional MerR regulator
MATPATQAERAPSPAALPPIPAKRYFTIGEVSELCAVKPHVLRYWEQEFTQLRPMKRRGNRRYYQHHEVLLVRRIRDLLYEQGFTISGARNRLGDAAGTQRRRDDSDSPHATAVSLASAPAELLTPDLTDPLPGIRQDLLDALKWLEPGLGSTD